MKKLQRRGKRAYNLIELLIVLGVISVLMAGTYLVYNSVRLTNQANSEIQNLNVIKSGIQNLYVTQSDYKGLTAALLAKSNIVPSNIQRDSGQNNIENQWGQTYTVTDSPTGTTNATLAGNKAFTMTTDIPKSACEKVAQGLIGSWDYVSVGGQVARDWDTSVQTDPTAILVGCQSASDPVSIVVGAR